MSFMLISSLVYSQVGITTPNPQGIFHVDGAKDNPATGTPTVAQQQNDFTVTPTGSVGIGLTAPSNKLEISTGITGTSGLKFTNMNSSSLPTANAAGLAVDANGNVVIQSAVSTNFKSFSINATTPTASLVTIGSLEFRYPATICTNVNSFFQVRSTTGANNQGILHATYTTAQNGTGFVNTTPTTITTAFTDLTSVPVNCVQDGHAQFNFFSYTDRTFYRVNIHIADGDSMGFGALGYIFVENQK